MAQGETQIPLYFANENMRRANGTMGPAGVRKLHGIRSGPEVFLASRRDRFGTSVQVRQWGPTRWQVVVPLYKSVNPFTFCPRDRTTWCDLGPIIITTPPQVDCIQNSADKADASCVGYLFRGIVFRPPEADLVFKFKRISLLLQRGITSKPFGIWP